VSHALVRAPRLDLDEFAAATGLHPDVVRKLVALAILEAGCDAAGQLWFARSQLARVSRVQRLRAGFALNYAATGLVIDLLDRIAALEAAGRRRSRAEGQSWTRTGLPRSHRKPCTTRRLRRCDTGIRTLTSSTCSKRCSGSPRESCRHC
jgi:chaperone modulatory protein CbpM